MRTTFPFISLALSTALVALVAAGCAADESVETAPPPSAALPAGPAHATLGTFVMHVKPKLGKVVIERLRLPSIAGAGAVGVGLHGEALDSMPIVSDNVAGSGPDYTVELVTDQNSFVDTYNAGASNGCAANSWCANVTLRHFYPGINLSGVYVVATQITDAQGAIDTAHAANNSTATNPFGLDATYGLWQYTTLGASGTTLAKGAGAMQTWSFKNPDDADVSVKLEVRGSLHPMLWFDKTGGTLTHTQTAALQAGQPASVHYNYARNTGCTGSSINAFLKGYNIDTHQMSYPYASSDTSFDVHMVMPFGPGVDVWFNNDNNGCTSWDTNGGANFNFAVADTATRVHFAGPTANNPPYWTNANQWYADSGVKAGVTIGVDYEIDRVLCGSLDRYGRVPTGTSVTMHYSLDGAGFIDVPLLGTPYGVPSSLNGTAGQVYITPTIAIPASSHKLTFYFDSANTGLGCQKWDSNGGSNYTFNY